jgi:hypothetical protein
MWYRRALYSVAAVALPAAGCVSYPGVEIQVLDAAGHPVANAPLELRSSPNTELCEYHEPDALEDRGPPACGHTLHVVSDEQGRFAASYELPAEAGFWTWLFRQGTVVYEYVEVERVTTSGDTVRTRFRFPPRYVRRWQLTEASD